ncbi:MAG TPA: ABC transporter substrate-binding protein [Acidimicrobiia bacterium]|jgi:branched-chain amino acid transport system substrate-binding protein
MKHHRTRALRAVVSVAVASLAAVTLVTTTAVAQSSEKVPGVTDKAVKLGFIFSGTGVASSTFKNSDKACLARVDRTNREGGVNGRKVEIEVIDDKSSNANLTAAKDLVENRDVYGVINNSSFAFLSYRYLQEQGVPTVGGGFDGTYYGEKGNEDILSALGNSAPFTGLAYTTSTKVMKQLGATKSAAIAYGASASSSASAQTLQDFAAPAVGIKPVYTNTAVDFGTSDVGPIVLGIKNSGADAAYLPLVAESNVAILQGLAQNGVDMKALVLPTGYGQALLDSPIAKTLGPEVVFFQTYKPVELNDKDTKQFQTDRKKVGLTGVPDYGQYTGYITCDLAITALEQMGKNVTREDFAPKFRKLGDYDAAGLNCSPYPVGLDSFGKFGSTGCSYYMQVKNGKFVVMNKGKPITGKLVGNKAALEANATGNPALVTTTTAAP